MVTKMKKQLKNQKGMTLGELSLVLLIAAGLGGWMYNKFAENQEEKIAIQEADDINRYVGRLQNAHTGDADFTTATTATARTTGIFPREMIQGTTVFNKYNGTVEVAPNQITNTNDSALFTLTNYSETGCRTVVPQIAKLARTVSVGGTAVKALNGNLDKAGLGNACGDTNTITFVISKK